MTKKVKTENLVIFVIGLLFVGVVIPSKFSVTLTPSLIYRVFYLKGHPQPHEIKKGDYVQFELHSSIVDTAKTNRVIKKVVCSGDEGDSLQNKGKDYYCNGEYLCTAKDFSLKHESIENFKYNGEIPKGKIFVMAGHKDSYDSRYFGFIDERDIEYLAYPVF